MKKIIVWFILLLCLSDLNAFAQDPIIKPANDTQKGFQWNKVFVGGNIGAQFGSITVVNISPIIGYRITERLAAGIGATYIYYNYRALRFSSSIYGASVFGRFYVLENIFAHAEYELLNVDSYDFPGTRTNIENIYVGGGFRQALGGRSYMTIMALWNINESKYSPYGNPIIRMGFSFGL
ncbi:MAG: hypothetical protein HYU69_14535 [Bacteroidetes bacterium]|nr:hypothetical protein [Bacteroidota bacterium]